MDRVDRGGGGKMNFKWERTAVAPLLGDDARTSLYVSMSPCLYPRPSTLESDIIQDRRVHGRVGHQSILSYPCKYRYLLTYMEYTPTYPQLTRIMAHRAGAGDAPKKKGRKKEEWMLGEICKPSYWLLAGLHSGGLSLSPRAKDKCPGDIGTNKHVQICARSLVHTVSS